MRFKRAMAASMAAVMAVSSAVVCQVTASAEEQSVDFSGFGAWSDLSKFDKSTNVATFGKEWDGLGLWLDDVDYSAYDEIVLTYSNSSVGNVKLIVEYNNDISSSVAMSTDDANGTVVAALDKDGKKSVKQLCVQNAAVGSVKIESIVLRNSAVAPFEGTKVSLPKNSIYNYQGTQSLKLASNISTASELVSEYGEVTVQFTLNGAISDGKTIDSSNITFNLQPKIKYVDTAQSINDWPWITAGSYTYDADTKTVTVTADIASAINNNESVKNNKISKYDFDSLNLVAMCDFDKASAPVDIYIDNIVVTGSSTDKAVESVSINKAEVKSEYNIGDTVELTATVTPADATDATVTWTSSKPGVATVDENGKVTAVGEGETTITAKAGDKTDTVVIKVVKKKVPVTITAGPIDGAASETDAKELAEKAVQVEADGLTASDYTVTVKVDGKKYTVFVELKPEAAKKYELTGYTTVERIISYKVTNLKLSADKLTIPVTSTAGVQITATIEPENLAEGDIEWATDDNTVATVENGLVKPVDGADGKKTTITATVKGTDVKAKCEVEVVKEVNPAVKVELDKAELSGTVGEKADLKAAVTAKDTTKDCTDNIVWTSSDEKVAAVANGVVTFVGEGTAEITATAGEASAVCKVTVKAATVAVDKVTLDKTSAELTVGDTATIKAVVTPDNATDKTVTWTSSDETVATVKDGVVTAVKAGKATITAKAGDKTATCAVTVKAKETDKPASDVFSGKADIKPTDLKTWNDNVQIGKTKVEEKSVVRIKYSIIDGDQHQIKVQDGDKWEVLTSIKTNEWGVTEVSKDGILEITLNSADAAAIANGGLAITGVGIRVESVDFNVVVDSKKYGNGSETKTEFVKTTVNADSTLNMLAVFSISEENAKNFEKYVVVIKRASDNKSIVEHVDTYYDAFDYTVDGVMHEGSSENGKHLIVLNLVNADPSWGAITVTIAPEGVKG